MCKLFTIIKLGWHGLFCASVRDVRLSSDVEGYKEELFDSDRKTESDNDRMRGDVRNVCIDVRNSFDKLALG